MWFNRALEQAFVVNANRVTAVSRPLIEKFSSLRQDIHLSPNGFTPAFLGEEHRDIAAKKQIQTDAIHLGYFGHLTESWFDWDFLLNVLQLARKKGINLFVHLIGYGEPDLQKKLARYSDRVKFYGRVHPSELYKYVKNWDAAMIWFRSGKLSEAVDPIKIYEYLYFGLPTIVKGIGHLENLPFTYVVANENQAVEALMTLHRNSLNGDKTNRAAVEELLVRSTWEQRFRDLLVLLEHGERMCL
jgi:glycosyltransferase involved in cell wall biosynthesis